MIQIVYACNDACFEGLYLSMLTILRRTKETINFNVLTGDLTFQNPSFVALTSRHKNELQKLVHSFGKGNSFRVIDCTKMYKDTLKSFNLEKKKIWHTPYAIFRLFIDKIPTLHNKALYLDIDTLARGDVAELYNHDITNYEVGVVHDYFHKHRLKKEYFNSGVMLFNIKMIKKTGLLEKSIKYLFTKSPLYPDQDALNMCVKSRFFFPNEYRFNYQNRGIRNDTVIRHFVWAPFTFMTKPWHENRVKKLLRIRCFDDDYVLWNKAKLNWHK